MKHPVEMYCSCGEKVKTQFDTPLAAQEMTVLFQQTHAVGIHEIIPVFEYELRAKTNQFVIVPPSIGAIQTNPSGIIEDHTLDDVITKTLTASNRKRNEAHVPSGKLSASMLGWPLQWQILKIIGVPQQEPDGYTLRKFLRGNHVEDWLITHMPGVVDQQKLVEYEGAVGYADTIVDCSKWECKRGIMPHEIKSTSNAKYRRIVERGDADTGHHLQACFYALGLGYEDYGIDYVATDDYRTKTFICPMKGFRTAVQDSIDIFYNQLGKRRFPMFSPKEFWQSSPKYNSYPDWQMLDPDDQMTKLERDYPASFKKLAEDSFGQSN